MERKRQLHRRILTVLTLFTVLMAASGCLESNTEKESSAEVRIVFKDSGYATRSIAPEENRIHDINLLVFCGESAEDRIWTRTPYDNSEHFITLNLLKGKRYSFYAFINFGKKIDAEEISDLNNLKVEIESAERFDKGIPMTAAAEDILIGEDSQITLELERMMAKISLRIDRSRLSEGVDININSIRIGNYPKYAYATAESKVTGSYDCLPSGFYLSGSQCISLNRSGQGGLSGEVSLYMLENMQGDFPWEIGEDEEKVFDDDDPRASVCSYIEIEADYRSDTHFSRTGLIYRFYLGDGLDNLDVERNCHYHITVSPEDDGLSGSGWRVDKTGLGKFVSNISIPENIEMTYKGETRQIDLQIIPSDASDKSVRWKSSDTKVATVSQDGTVTATGEGDCMLTCTAADGSGTTATCGIHVEFAPPYFRMYPGDYIEGKVGDKIHIWCEFFPPNAPFDPGMEELNYDKGRGIYDYKLDENGHGVTLTLKNPGTGIVYMTAGAPVNESGMVIVVVNR